jgi:hypothetical protein
LAKRPGEHSERAEEAVFSHELVLPTLPTVRSSTIWMRARNLETVVLGLFLSSAVRGDAGGDRLGRFSCSGTTVSLSFLDRKSPSRDFMMHYRVF